MAHLCYGYSLQGGTKKIAIFQIVWNTFWLITTYVLLLDVLTNLTPRRISHQNQSSNNGTGKSHRANHWWIHPSFSEDCIPVLFAVFILCLVSFTFALILLEGSKEKHHGKCYAWLYFQFILVFTSLLFVPMLQSLMIASGAVVAVVKALLWISLVSNVYFIWVVETFMKEIMAERNSAQTVAGNPDEVKGV